VPFAERWNIKMKNIVEMTACKCDNLVNRQNIAVVIPVYNAAKVLRPCIRSVLNQKFSNISLILVDDGSTDGSGIICDSFAESDKRIHVIHKKNAGAVEARKTGVFSEVAQGAKYITFCDADDMLSPDALNQLYKRAEQFNADMVCGRVEKIWKFFHIPQRYQPPCFQFNDVRGEKTNKIANVEASAGLNGVVKVYSHQDIIEKLYISCFGISDFPVSLYAKLYRTELITKASEGKTVVHFMGEDLTVTLKVMPEAKKLVIIPAIVYQYRFGGGTSRFMPSMLEDFLSLYTYKKEFADRYAMPYDVEYLMNIELMNVLQSWLISYVRDGRHDAAQLIEEIKRVCALCLIKESAAMLCNRNDSGKQKSKAQLVAIAVNTSNYEKLEQIVQEQIKSSKWMHIIKKILLSL